VIPVVAGIYLLNIFVKIAMPAARVPHMLLPPESSGLSSDTSKKKTFFKNNFTCTNTLRSISQYLYQQKKRFTIKFNPLSKLKTPSTKTPFTLPVNSVFADITNY
jgi:hypothetical protein